MGARIINRAGAMGGKIVPVLRIEWHQHRPPRRPRSNGTVTAAATNPINSFVDSLCVRHGVNYQKDVGSPTIDGGSANWKAMRLGKKDGRYCAAHKMGRKVLYALGMTKTSQPLNPEGPGLVKTFKRWAAFVKKCRLFDNSQKEFQVKLGLAKERGHRHGLGLELGRIVIVQNMKKHFNYQSNIRGLRILR